jgi:hypothetical protein
VLGINPRISYSPHVVPYVSFVAEKQGNKLNGLGTHVGYFDVTWKMSDETDDTDDTDSTSDNADLKFCGRDIESKEWNKKEYNYYGASDEENYYGNTVSTEFVTGFIPGDLYTYNKMRWTIEIPAETTYVKSENGDSFGISKDEKIKLGDEVLTDSPEDSDINAPKVNVGSIYKVAGFTSNTDTTDESGTADTNIGKLKLVYDLGIKCTGNATIVFGLVIDNLYAPEALATEARFETGDNTDEGYIEIAAPENGVQPDGTVRGVFAESSDGYYKHKDNEYWNADPENPNNTISTSNTNNTNAEESVENVN